MAGRKNSNKIKSTYYVFIELTFCARLIARYLSDGCLKLLKIARIVLFVFFPTLNWFYLTPNFHLLL